MNRDFASSMQRGVSDFCGGLIPACCGQASSPQRLPWCDPHCLSRASWSCDGLGQGLGRINETLTYAHLLSANEILYFYDG